MRALSLIAVIAFVMTFIHPAHAAASLSRCAHLNYGEARDCDQTVPDKVVAQILASRNAKALMGNCEIVNERGGGIVMEYSCTSSADFWDHLTWLLEHGSGTNWPDVIHQDPQNGHWFVVWGKRPRNDN